MVPLCIVDHNNNKNKNNKLPDCNRHWRGQAGWNQCQCIFHLAQFRAHHLLPMDSIFKTEGMWNMFCFSFSFLFYLHFHSLGWEVILIAKVHQTSSAWFTCIFPKNQKEWIDENGVNLRQVLSPPKTLPQSGFHTGQPYEQTFSYNKERKKKEIQIFDESLIEGRVTICQIFDRWIGFGD